MSQGTACRCPERAKDITARAWVVVQRRGNASAFNGYHWTPSDYSCLHCRACRAVWRTNAAYVYLVPDGDL